MERPEIALVITPHPDDAEIGCGGTVASWIAQGTEVFYVLCTNGDKGSQEPDMTSERLAEIRGTRAGGGRRDSGREGSRLSAIPGRRAGG